MKIVAWSLQEIDSTKNFAHVEGSILSWKNWSIKNGIKFSVFGSLSNDEIVKVVRDRYPGVNSKILAVTDDMLIRWDGLVDFDRAIDLFKIPSGVLVSESIEILKKRHIVKFQDLSLIPFVWSQISHLYL